MTGLISLTCPACGAKLTITDDKDRFICDYCSNEQLIDRNTITVSKVYEKVISPQEPELVRESPSELAIDRLEQEIFELEGTLEEIGIPTSTWEIVTSATSSFLFHLLFAGALFFGAWAVGEVEIFEGISLLLMQFTLGAIGIGILSSAVGVLKNGAVRISNFQRDTDKRTQALEQMNYIHIEMDQRQAVAFNVQAEETSLELASEHAIRRLKDEIAEFENKILYLDKPESIPSIVLSTLLGVIVLILISNWLISWASSQTLPTFIEAQLTGEGPLPSSVWWFLGISGIVFAVLPLTTIEGGIQKLNRRRFHLEETNRLEGLLTPKMEALKQHQNALSQLVR